jgi:hypothetical protein
MHLRFRRVYPLPLMHALPLVPLRSFLLVLLAVVPGLTHAIDLGAQRVNAIAPTLTDAPVFLGAPITDRGAWTSRANLPAFQKILRNAEKSVDQPLPALPDDLYLEYSRSGNRTLYQQAYSPRQARILVYAIAECLEARGRFIEPFEQLVRALAAQPTWVLPAHDHSLNNFHGRSQDPDLSATAIAFDLATARALLGDKLSPEIRDLIRDEVNRRVLDPVRAMISGQRKPLWWMSSAYNWNAVCVGNSVGAALALSTDRTDRARFVALGEHCAPIFLSGFESDGTCVEGVGYWEYGFSHFVLLAELTGRATRWKLDLFTLPRVAETSRYPLLLEIAPGLFPAYGDCGRNQRPDAATLSFLNRRLGLGLAPVDVTPVPLPPRSALFHLFPNSASNRPAPPVAAVDPLRAWFPAAQVLTGRPAPGGRLAASLRGGRGGVPHGHADLGSYLAAVDGVGILGDPGGEVYTARTFSSKRWESRVLNSYGHPVPWIDGILQDPTESARAAVKVRRSHPLEEYLQLDLRSAYRHADVKSVERTFTFSRAGTGSLVIRDQITLAKPRVTGTTLLTFGEWKRVAPDRIHIALNGKRALVRIDTGGKPFEVRDEKMTENFLGGGNPTRLAVLLTQPTLASTITTTITPEP